MKKKTFHTWLYWIFLIYTLPGTQCFQEEYSNSLSGKFLPNTIDEPHILPHGQGEIVNIKHIDEELVNRKDKELNELLKEIYDRIFPNHVDQKDPEVVRPHEENRAKQHSKADYDFETVQQQQRTLKDLKDFLQEINKRISPEEQKRNKRLQLSDVPTKDTTAEKSNIDKYSRYDKREDNFREKYYKQLTNSGNKRQRPIYSGRKDFGNSQIEQDEILRNIYNDVKRMVTLERQERNNKEDLQDLQKKGLTAISDTIQSDQETNAGSQIMADLDNEAINEIDYKDTAEDEVKSLIKDISEIHRDINDEKTFNKARKNFHKSLHLPRSNAKVKGDFFKRIESESSKNEDITHIKNRLEKLFRDVIDDK